MLKTKSIKNLTILRIIAIIAIISFSFEISSTFLVSDDVQVEVIDLDLEDDSETDEEFETTDISCFIDTAPGIESGTFLGCTALLTLADQHLEELPTPPPDLA